MAVIESPSLPREHRRPLRSGWSSFGPAAIVVLAALGPGDLVSNSASGSTYGYSLLWALALAVLFRFVVLEASARYVLVTGDTLSQGYDRCGRWVVWSVLVASIWKRVFSNLYLIVFMGMAGHLLLPLPTPWSRPIWSTLFTIIGFGMLMSGSYSAMERFCKYLIGALGASLILAAALSSPDPVAIARGLVPSFTEGEQAYSAILLVTALIGAEGGSLGNLTYTYLMQEKGWVDTSAFPRQRVDLAIGALSLFVMGALLQIAAAGTLQPLGVNVQTEQDLLRIFSETLGWFGMVVFVLGMWGAAFSTFVGNGMGYGLVVTDIFRRFVSPWNDRSRDPDRIRPMLSDPVFRWTVGLWTLVPLIMAWASVDAILLAILINALLVFLIPILGVALLRITSDAELMGVHRNGAFTNFMIAALIAISIYLIFGNGLSLWTSLVGALGL